MSKKPPAEVFLPGEYIQDELEARGWSQIDLAQVMGRPAAVVSQIIAGKRAITPETAKGLAAAFGTSPELWMNLENAYQLSKVKTDSDEVSHRAKLYLAAPVYEMTRRGWLLPSHSVSDTATQLRRFFGTEDLDNIRQVKAAARKSTDYSTTSVPLRAWYYRAIQLSRALSIDARFSPEAVESGLEELRALSVDPENIRLIPRLLGSWGVRLVVLERLEKTKVDGAAIWPEENTPVVAMSLRFDRIDNFFFTLFHELHHVIRRESSIDSDIESYGTADETDEMELRANRDAGAKLVPQDKLKSFVLRTRPMYSRKRIEQFAAVHDIHPGIVLGQLHHQKEVPQKNLRDMLTPVRQYLVDQTITDGWGHQAGAF